MQIEIGKTDDGRTIGLPLKYANRHGLVAGATGTGKTVSLQRMAEQFSNAGVPVFTADIKGDLSGISTACPTTFWDIAGEHGHPIKTSLQEMGELTLSRMLNANATQEGTLAIALQRARHDHDYMLGLDDLRWQLADMAENRETVCSQYGNVTASSINAIQRNLIALQSQDGDNLFGEPPFEIEDFMRLDASGKGYVNLLHADKLMHTPKLYGALIFWLLNQLLQKLPEVGDAEKPKLVFFFDEAHILFRDAPKHLLEAVERVVRLIRSKGVGVYFVTQTPADVPDRVLAQLGNRIQHALRAFTPKEQRLVKAAARAFRPNEGVDVERAVLDMGVGEALVSMLISDGVPAPVERIRVKMPKGKMGPIDGETRQQAIAQSPMGQKYPNADLDEQKVVAFHNRMRQRDGIDPVKPPKEREHADPSVEENLDVLRDDLSAPTEPIKKGQFKAGLLLVVVAFAVYQVAQLI
jgi:DNA helicase HerA-like ATPase